MTTKRIIPCLDIANGRVVKGQKFQAVQDVADPVTLAEQYDTDGADELVCYNIAADSEGWPKYLEVVRQIASVITIPLTAGGGIRTLEQMQQVLDAGARKLSINSAAVSNPDLIAEASAEFGSERVVLSIDAAPNFDGSWHVYQNGGQTDTELDAVNWAVRGEQLGAGELVLNAIHTDGEQTGYDLELIETVARRVQIPVVASGGAGNAAHVLEALKPGRADAALGASVFHYGVLTVSDLKTALEEDMDTEALQFDENGLLPAIIQDVRNGRVLTLAYMNRTALDTMLATGETWLFSRTRETLWHKGETSGNTQTVKHIAYDCDQDALLVQVEPHGPACHTGQETCFHHTLYGAGTAERDVLTQLTQRIHERHKTPAEGTYTSYLFREGIDKILKKVGEESSEVIIGAKNQDKAETTWEIADLTYHTLVLMEVLGISAADVRAELSRRQLEKEGDSSV